MKYKVGDKVVMKIISADQDEIKTYSVSGVNDDWRWCLPQNLLERYTEPLSNYTEPLEAKIRRQAAEITRLLAENKELKNKEQELTRERNQLMGRCGGLSAARIKEFNNGRLAGQKEAWELARKIINMPLKTKKDIWGREVFLPTLDEILDEIFKNTYQEAAAKVAEWEKVKEIKVGDVLEDMASSKVKCVVTNIYPGNMAYLVFNDGSAGMHELENMKKTGRHIDIDSFLKQIGEE